MNLAHADLREKLLALIGGRRGHFQMESGYHSEQWFTLDRMFAQPEALRPYVVELAKRLAAHQPDAVCGPMTGGAKLAGLIAAELGVEYFFTERFAPRDATGLFPVRSAVPEARRAAVRGKSAVIVDDAVSAGSAVRGSYADLVACGARPVALGALFVFGAGAARFAAEKNLALESLVQTSFGIWPPAECPLCKSGVELEIVSDLA